MKEIAPSDRPYLEVVYSNKAATSTVYFLKDHSGSIRATVLDSAGAPVIAYDDYDPWGYPLALRTMPIPNAYLQGASKNKFIGKEWDDELGLDWVWIDRRPYVPVMGRWVVMELLAEKYPSWSSYHYALDNPMRFYDMDGRDMKNATKRNVVVVGDIKSSDDIAYAVLGEGDRTEGLEGDFDFYRFADEDEKNATWYKVSKSDWIDVDVTETGKPKITNLLGTLLAKLPKIHVRKATPEEAELAETLKKRVEKKKEQEADRKQEEERRKQEEERKKRKEEGKSKRSGKRKMSDNNICTFKFRGTYWY